MFLLDLYGSIRLNSIPFLFRPFQLVLSASIQHSDWWQPASSASWSCLWSSVQLYLLFYFNKSPSRASLNFHHSKNMQHSHCTISMLHALLVIPTIIQLIQQEMANLCLSPKKRHPHLFQHSPTKKSKLHQFFPQESSPPSPSCSDCSATLQVQRSGTTCARSCGGAPRPSGPWIVSMWWSTPSTSSPSGTGNRGWMDIWVDSKVGIRDFCSTVYVC